MNRKYNIQLNLSPYANYYAVGGNTGFKEVLEEENPVEFNRQLETQKDNKFLDFMNNSGGGGWAAAIAPAATNAINAITNTEASTAERVATAMGIPALAKIWTADTTAGDANLKAMQSNIDNFAKQNLIQDASSTFGANNAVKLNNKFIAPVPMTGVKDLSWKDFRGNMFKKGAAATLQGAAAGSVGGPWGALGGAIVGLGSSLFGGIGAKRRAKKAYADYQNKMATLTSQANSMYKQALTNQTLSNMQALANGNMSQRINDMANIRAYGGNLYPIGGGIDPYYPESQDPTAVNWLSDWYRQRPEQLKNTFYGSTYEMPNPNISGEYEDLNEIPQERILSPTNRMFGDDLYKNLIDRAATASTIYRMDMPYNTLGEYSPAGKGILTENGPVDKPNAAHTISFNMRDVPAFANPDEDYYDKETLPLRIHENNHAITHGFDSVAEEINNRIVRKEGVEKDSYKDNPYEVHSYMMEFRNKAGLNPTDIITKDMLNKYRKELKETNLDRYTDDSLIDLLNNVVDNNDMKRYSNVAAFGGGLDLSPNMMSLWNNKQQIDQQKAMNQQFSLGLGKTAFANQFAGGGQMTSADVPDNMQYYANGGTHEENPYGGIQVGTDQQGTPNLTEEGEFKWNDFVFSDRINVDANLLSSFNLMPTTKYQNKKATKDKLSYADMAKKYAKRNKELENDPITKNSMEAFMQRLANAQEYQKKEAQLEAKKQNELQDYKTALNKQNNNPMYGTMKYNGMGNAATQQGVNSGVDAGMGNPMSNADLSNVNRSGNEMMAAYGGNLFARGGDEDPYPYYNFNFIPTTGITSVPFEQGQNADVNNFKITPTPRDVSAKDFDLYNPFSWWHTAYVGRPLLDNRPSYISKNNPNSAAPAVSTYGAKVKGTNNTVYDEYGNNITLYPKGLNALNSNEYLSQLERNNPTKLIVPNGTGWGIPQNSNNEGLNLGIGISQQPTDVSNADAQYTYKTDDEGTTERQSLTGSIDVSDKIIDKTTPNTNPDAAVPSDPKEAPLYSIAGKYAQFGKGIMPMIWDWANRTNVKYDPYQRDADRLEALANEGPALRTADTIGGYRAPNLMDVERLNNSARAEGLAQMQAILDAANGNRGFVGAQSAQNNYNTQKGIGDNYVKAQEANNAERLQTDQFNHGINVANQNAINAMYQDNQRAEQAQHQAALSGTAQAAALRQRENLHAVNTERMKNRATSQAAAVDNALNYFTTQAMENQELNTRNNDPTNPYWIDKYGRTHYTGDSGLTQAIRDEFGDDEYGRNGTFTGERLTEWNNLTKRYKAKDLKEHPELWRHLVTQQREANRIDAEKAKQARLEELEALRGTYQSNLARLNALRDSGAIISDPSYNLYASWADEDYSGNQGLLRNRNQALDQYITQIGNNYDRYLYEQQLAQNQIKALGGYLNVGQNNNNDYYSYTRI